MYDIIIIGSGPAGLAAGIYAGRATLNTLIIDTSMSGGTVNSAPLIENYPGFTQIPGRELMENMSKHAEEYTTIKQYSKVKKIEKKDDGTFQVSTRKDEYQSKFLILATGTSRKTLDIPAVKEYENKGLSYCAVCDGSFFNSKDVLVIGGGNSAATQALYLKRIGVNCSIVHRRDELRCDKKLQEDIKKMNIPIFWNSELIDIKGEGRVEQAILYNKNTDKETVVDTKGIFIAIGDDPNNTLAIESGVNCNKSGYIITDKNMKTNINGVYAAGDITGGLKQIVVAISQGATAASKIQEQI